MSSENCEKDYADFTIPQLKAELRKRGGRLSGKKHQLKEYNTCKTVGRYSVNFSYIALYVTYCFFHIGIILI